MLQGEIAYDTSPVESKDLTPNMPIDKQIHFIVDAQYDWSNSTNVGGAFVYANYDDAKIKDPLLAVDY